MVMPARASYRMQLLEFCSATITCSPNLLLGPRTKHGADVTRCR